MTSRLLAPLALFILSTSQVTEPVRSCCRCADTGEPTCWEIKDPPPDLTGEEICALNDALYAICAVTDFGLQCPDVCEIWSK